MWRGGEEESKFKQQTIEDITDSLNTFENHHEYIENQSRLINIKSMGVPEDRDTEKSLDDIESVVKKLISHELGFEEDIKTERCHRIGNVNPVFSSFKP